MDPLRDRVFGLLSDLCGSPADLTPDGLRLLSHTLLGVARDNAPSSLFAVRDALPWVVALVESGSGTVPGAVAEMLTTHGVVRALNRETIASRLEAAVQKRPSLMEASSGQSRVSRALRDLALLDARLADLAMCSDTVIRDTLMEKPGLLGAAISICAGGDQTAVARRFRAALLVDDVVLDPSPLRLLCDLETAWDGGSIGVHGEFCERTRRFELSACDHLRQSGIACAIRAALVFSTVSTRGGDIRGKLRAFTTFAEDRSLEDLTVALAENRGRVVDFLSGRSPLRTLDGWVRYLRGPCHELADLREISIREAMSFAHFAFHLMNFCDLASRSDGAANDEARLAVMAVEDDLKEFALSGQRAGLSDDEVHLGRWARDRWADVTVEEQLLEHVARLAGGWRAGLSPTVDGARPRLQPDALHPWVRALGAFCCPDETLALIHMRLATMSIRGAELFEVAHPRHALRLLAMGTLAASGPGVLDFESALSWFNDASRRPLAEAMLDLVDDEVLLTRLSGPCGFVAERTSTGVSVSVRRHAEFEALLVLIRTPDVAPLMRELARDRLEALVCVVSDASETSDSDPVAPARMWFGRPAASL